MLGFTAKFMTAEFIMSYRGILFEKTTVESLPLPQEQT
jgi:hypothetical protein